MHYWDIGAYTASTHCSCVEAGGVFLSVSPAITDQTFSICEKSSTSNEK